MNRKIEKQIRKKGKKKRFYLSIFAFIMLLFVPVFVYASEMKSDGKTTQVIEEENKTVRVGYFPYSNFQEGSYGEHKQGAGYEYLQKISYITGWKYEYVYGSFKECLDMLADGKIDILGSVSYTPERAESIDFSTYAEGTEKYWIYTREDHTDLTDGDLKQMNGCRIGVADGSYQKDLLEKWLDSNQIHAEVVACKGYDEMIEKLNADELDALVIPALSVNSDFIAIANIGAGDCYFGVSKSRPDLLKELNATLEEINNTETDYSSKLYARYEGKAVINYALNKEEKQWLDAHENTIRVGYLKDNLPFCGEENGKLTGILGTVLDTVQEKYEITIKVVPCSTGVQMNEALQSGEIDIAGPIIQDFYIQEQFQVVLTDAIFDITPVVIYKGNEYSSSLSVIATTETSLYSELMVSLLFPDAEIKQYDTQQECLEAVANGKVGATVIPSSKINLLNESPLTKSLSFAEMAKRQELAMFTTRENRRAATIINKAIDQSSNILNGVVLAQNSVSEKKMTLQDVLTEYAGFVIGVSFVIIFVLLLLLYSLSVSRKKQMEALKEAQDANAANIAKTTFLNHMSPDIRTPMNAIVGFTDIAMKRKPDKEVEDCLKKIRQSSEYLMTLINDVLDISRIESGKLEYKPVLVDLRDMTDTVLSIARGYMENRDLNFYVSREELKNPYVMADELRIREVLLNIISNAVKFTKDGGTISFVAENCPDKDEHHLIVRYHISDTGIGMSEEFQTRIFDEFSQENNGARTSYKGTGLGMAIAKRYVDLMGGKIEVSSRQGVGSAFTVEIPLLIAEHVLTEEKEKLRKDIDLHGLHVLLAEDNDLNAEIAIALLEEKGMIVTRTTDGKSALTQFCNTVPGTFDLILMDIMMPEMNGYETTKAIRNLPDRPDGKEIPIIAMTANAFAEDVQAALKAGMDDHVAKPIDMSILISVITKYIEQ
ncbi:response regulator [Blautia obeum]|uniref:Circadian input-output histidine kinase CikA n=1 Tax=Blautia obeum TaxID=40520 RepID=A0A564S683_9FIRM|nr:transporter substrate-binding domain-containing protein [Blautia obeum]VUW90657.1 Aerobic respiration control sensor protein ArcB [Blautia obeum]